MNDLPVRPDGPRSAESIDEAGCLRLLASASIGRLVFTYRALPEVIPVNYRLDGRTLVLRVGASSRAARAALDAVVAFQVDRLNEENRAGWTVVVVGRSHPFDPSDDDAAQPLPWVEGEHDLHIAIPVERVSGRRLIPDLAS